jgi:hypothetical protein
MDEQRFDCSIRFFGREGQERLRAARVGVVGHHAGISSPPVHMPFELGLAVAVALGSRTPSPT